MNKKIFIISLVTALLFSISGHAQKLVRAEYFFDNKDPGVGQSKYHLRIGLEGIIDSTITIPESLPGGFHIVFIRVLDSIIMPDSLTLGIHLNTFDTVYHSKRDTKIDTLMRWTLYQGATFYIDSNNINVASQLKKAEYFFDKDSGFVTGCNILSYKIRDSIDTSITTITLPSRLIPGFHNIFIRVQDLLGRWSIYQGGSFYVEPNNATATSPIIQAEYFFDKDSGFNTGCTFLSFAKADSVNISRLITIPASLKVGTHNIFIRTLDSLGRWSLYQGESFYVCAGAPQAYLHDTVVCANSLVLSDSSKAGSTSAWYKLNSSNKWVKIGSSDTITIRASGKYYVTVTQSGTCTVPDTFSVIIKPFPGITTGSSKPICFGDSTTIGAAPVSGVTYSWTSSPAGFSSTVSSATVKPLVTTTYYLLANNGYCSKTDSLVITVNPLPAANAGSNNTVCNSSSISIGAKAIAGDTYSWTSNPSGFASTVANPSISPSNTTTYTLTEKVTATGCSSSNMVVITVNALPAANAGKNKGICIGDSASIGAATVNGDTYSWTSEPTGFTSTGAVASPAPTVTTTYYLTEKITATGCSKSDSVVVKVNPLPDAHWSAKINGSYVQFTPDKTGQASYLWHFDATDSSISSSPNYNFAATGTYPIKLKVTNSNGCSAEFDSSITISTLSVVYYNDAGIGSVISPSVAICAGLAQVSVSIKNYGDGVLKKAQINLEINGVAQTVYSWTGSLLKDSSATVNIGSYTFASGTTNLLAYTSLPNGIKDSLTFNDTTKSSITVNPLPSADAGKSSAICFGDSANIGTTAVSGNTYSWVSNPTGFASTMAGASPAPTITTTYTLSELVSATGCSASNSVTITVNPLPDPHFSLTNTSGRSYTFQADDKTLSSYNWIFGDTKTGAGDNIAHTYVADGTDTVSLSVKNANGCVADWDTVITVSTPTGLSKALADNINLIVYPNPFSAITNINYNLPSASHVQVSVTDVDGKTIAILNDAQETSGSHTIPFDANKYNCAKGVYFVKMVIDNEVTVRQVVKID